VRVVDVLIEVVVIVAAVAFWIGLIMMPDKKNPNRKAAPRKTADQTEKAEGRPQLD
jgi:hypothetical protein